MIFVRYFHHPFPKLWKTDCFFKYLDVYTSSFKILLIFLENWRWTFFFKVDHQCLKFKPCFHNFNMVHSLMVTKLWASIKDRGKKVFWKILPRWCADPNGERLFGAEKPRQGEDKGRIDLVSLTHSEGSNFRNDLHLFSKTLGAGTRKSRRGGVFRLGG